MTHGYVLRHTKHLRSRVRAPWHRCAIISITALYQAPSIHAYFNNLEYTKHLQTCSQSIRLTPATNCYPFTQVASANLMLWLQICKCLVYSKLLKYTWIDGA